MAEKQNHDSKARSGKTHATDPGHTPGQAEGEREQSDTGNPPYEPGHTAGQAEGEENFAESYDYQRQAVRDQGNGSSGRNRKMSDTFGKQLGRVRSQVQAGVQRFNESMQEGGTAAQIREQFQTMAEQQEFSADEIKRWLAMIAGGFLAFHGFRRSLGSLSIAGVGAALFYWGFSGESPVKLLRQRNGTTHWEAESRIRNGETSRSMHMRTEPQQATRSIIVKADLDKAFTTWANFENFPRFMQHIKSVEKTGDDLSHWVMEGPLGTRIEWDAKTTRFEPNKRIGWSSIRGDIKTSGQVTFNKLPENELEVTVTLQYIPPMGMAGEAVAHLLDNPEDKLEEDLRNFKRFIESA